MNCLDSGMKKSRYFLQDDGRQFEHSFFDIDSLETTHMDPQQRKPFDNVFEYRGNAGVCLEKAAGSNAGSLVGKFPFYFQLMQTEESD